MGACISPDTTATATASPVTAVHPKSNSPLNGVVPPPSVELTRNKRVLSTVPCKSPADFTGIEGAYEWRVTNLARHLMPNPPADADPTRHYTSPPFYAGDHSFVLKLYPYERQTAATTTAAAAATKPKPTATTATKAVGHAAARLAAAPGKYADSKHTAAVHNTHEAGNGEEEKEDSRVVSALAHSDDANRCVGVYVVGDDYDALAVRISGVVTLAHPSDRAQDYVFGFGPVRIDYHNAWGFPNAISRDSALKRVLADTNATAADGSDGALVVRVYVRVLTQRRRSLLSDIL